MPSDHTPQAEIARLSDLPPLEWAALLNLHAWAPDPDEHGWHVNEPEALAGSDMKLSQFRSALGRLRRKGLVSCHQWHPGQGDALAEWLWFLTERGLELVESANRTPPGERT